MKIRNQVSASVNVAARDEIDTATPAVIQLVVEAMNRTAAERGRRVFQSPWFVSAEPLDGDVIALTYAANTEPA